MKKFLKKIYFALQKVCPPCFFLIEYGRASKRMGSVGKERDRLFNEFLDDCREKKCMQIGVKDDIGRKFGSNWVSVDKYDERDFIDYHYDIHDLEFEDETFDAVVCTSILEHVPYPQKAIEELHRVLKPGGKIWVQLPFQMYYHEAPKDYWRVSPDGLRVWMKDFSEITCGNYLWARTSLVTATFFYGTRI